MRFIQSSFTSGIKTCPICNSTMEFCSGKKSKIFPKQFDKAEYLCRHCRAYVVLTGMSAEDQHELAQEAFE